MNVQDKILWNRYQPYGAVLWKGIQDTINTSPDGIVGEKTVQAISEYQSRNGLLSDGLCGRTTLTHISLTHLHEPQGIWWNGKMAIDADGSGQTYNSLNTGFDSIHNAGVPGRYPGLAKDQQGNPYVWKTTSGGNQWYVSQTALTWPGKPTWDPKRYVDPTLVNYVVLPRNMKSLCSQSIKLGDIGLVFRLEDPTKRIPVICGDIGPKKDFSKPFGEASILVGEMLEVDLWDYKEKEIEGKNVSYRQVARGSNAEFIYLLFPGSGIGKAISLAEINERCESAFEDWGGSKRIEMLFMTPKEDSPV